MEFQTFYFSFCNINFSETIQLVCLFAFVCGLTIQDDKFIYLIFIQIIYKAPCIRVLKLLLFEVSDHSPLTAHANGERIIAW